MTENQPLVSVLMTAYNRQDYIGDAIESVLSSSYENWELIIVDDCSNDDTYLIAKEYAAKDHRIEVYKNDRNLGDYPNRNKAAAYAKGKYLKYLDSDDLIYFYTLELMVGFMEKFPQAALGLQGGWKNEGPYPVLSKPLESYRYHFFKRKLFVNAPTSVIIKRECFEKIGGFKIPRLRGDFDLWLRMAAIYPLVKMIPYLTWARAHDNQENVYNYYSAQLDYEIVMNALNSSNCPLSGEELNKAIYRIKKKYSRFILSKALKSGEWKESFRLYKKIDLRLIDFVR